MVMEEHNFATLGRRYKSVAPLPYREALNCPDAALGITVTECGALFCELICCWTFPWIFRKAIYDDAPQFRQEFGSKRAFLSQITGRGGVLAFTIAVTAFSP